MKSTSSWKYLSANTEVLRADGSEVKVAELKTGDTILGSNEDVRTVLSIFPFKSQNYRIIPRFKKSFVINEFQSLPVMTMDERVFLINVNQFYNYSNRNDFSLLHNEVNFEEQEQQVTLEPYILGCWLSSNVFTQIQFQTNTPQISKILDFISKFSLSHINYGDYIVINDVRIINQFHKYDLFACPRIPKEYKFNSRSVRTRVFNGFCDSSVYNMNRISIVGETLMNDFCYLVHSLGYLSECKVLMPDIFTVSYTYNCNIVVKNDFKVAKVNDKDSVCIQLDESNEVGILLSDFTIV
jgi:hypothetical protein